MGKEGAKKDAQGGSKPKPAPKPASKPAPKAAPKADSAPTPKPAAKAAPKPASQAPTTAQKGGNNAPRKKKEMSLAGFETVKGRKEGDKNKSKKAAPEAPVDLGDFIVREYPLHKDQVKLGLSKKNLIEEESNAKLMHKESPYPGNPGSIMMSGSNIAVAKAELALCRIFQEKKHEEPIPTSKRGDPMIGVIVGPQGTTIQKLRDIAPKAKIQLPEQGGTCVAIYGQTAEIQQIAAAIRQLSGTSVDASQVQLNKEEVEVHRKIPKDSKGRPMRWILIGQGGSNAKRIREETGVRMDVPPQHSTSDEYTLRGSVEAIDRASCLIHQLVEEAGELATTDPEAAQAAMAQAQAQAAPKRGARDPLVVPSTSGARTCVAPRLHRLAAGDTAPPPAPKPQAARVVPVPMPMAMAAVATVDVGPSMLLDIPRPPSGHSPAAKQRVKELAAEYSVRAEIYGNDSIRLDGPQQRCHFAERAILQSLGITKAQVPIPLARTGEPMIGLAIGPKGTTIAEMRARSGDAVVLLPDDGAGLAEDSVTIFGTPKEVEKAVAVVHEKFGTTGEGTRRTAAGDPSIMEVELDVPCDWQQRPLISLIIGPGGKNVKWIREESGAEIDLPKRGDAEGPSKYKLKGTYAQIEAAQKCIQTLLGDSGH